MSSEIQSNFIITNYGKHNIKLLDLENNNQYNVKTNKSIKFKNKEPYPEELQSEIRLLSKLDIITGKIVEFENRRYMFKDLTNSEINKIFYNDIPNTKYINDHLQKHINSEEKFTVNKLHSEYENKDVGFINIYKQDTKPELNKTELTIMMYKENYKPPYKIFKTNNINYTIILYFYDLDNSLIQMLE